MDVLIKSNGRIRFMGCETIGRSMGAWPGEKSVPGLRASFYSENEKRKGDPFSPAIRSKGEKARNRRKRK
jgi:hypothetical protein